MRARRVDRDPPPGPLVGLGAAAPLAAALTLLATAGQQFLPPMFVSRNDAHMNLGFFNISLIVLLAVSMATILWRRTSILDTWLLVSLTAILIESVLKLFVAARFTVGWYGLLLLMLLSSLVLLLALIAESNRLYVRLALSTAARDRERDSRMMSMDGVASAISHEVGQPLTAVSLTAAAALDSLTRPQPDRESAIRSLRDTIEAAQRAFSVVKSIRAMFGKRANALSEFDINELVRETASLLDREMTAGGISLRLAMDDTAPLILANRVQIQRVLVNLLTNAIESVGSRHRRGRRIVVRSMALNPEVLRLEVSDTGPGIPPEALDRIFEPFFTTKASGTGLGLSLCRTIVEEHGGRLWSSSLPGEGATFHLELRRFPEPTL